MPNTCLVWGVLNVTPDSFSDGGEFATTELAIARALDMVAQGAAVIDVGGESTRPGAQRISVETELARVVPVVTELVARGISVSVDTMRAEVAAAAIKIGARYINDVSGGQADPQMHAVIANSEVDYVIMHWRGHSDVMNSLTTYDNVVADVLNEMKISINNATAAGISSERIVIDPGLGFSKDAHHNWELLRNIEQFNSLGHRVLVGASRKRFLSDCVTDNAGDSTAERDAATAAVTTLVALKNIWAVRVHEVASSVAAVKVVAHMVERDELG
jgi:dihydropteroate synthase